ncbi:hypothetical protein [Sphingomonas japonica]|uniref:Uncharacterized protein n=1 Tax=Sphingomonas japonica TaxID=511662 RepID=A0ABX0U076_9SPHN|nr:hypothetical protein [Sphingomonas japonica]NIJ23971.1 hypothetical protein [Sphingomonas japonica]
MRGILRSGFTRYFLSGFVLGAIGLVAVQTADAESRPAMSAQTSWAVTESAL